MSNPYGQYPQDPTQGEQPAYGQQQQYGQQPYAQHPYPVSPYGQYQAPMPEHPQGTVVLILGILGFVVGVTGPIAWYMGSKALKEIRASGIRYSNENLINIGRILGIVTTAIMALVVLFYVLVFVVFFGAIFAAGASGG